MLQQVRGEDGVAQLARVGAGVGQAEQQPVVAQHLGELVVVGIGKHHAEPGTQVVGERDVAHHVQRVHAALLGKLGKRRAVEQVRRALRSPAR